MTRRPHWLPSTATLPATVAVPVPDGPRFDCGFKLSVASGTAVKRFNDRGILWLGGRPHVATSVHAIDRARYLGATAMLCIYDNQQFLFDIDAGAPYKSPRFEPQRAYDLTTALNRAKSAVTG